VFSLEKSGFELLNDHHWVVQRGGQSYVNLMHQLLVQDRAEAMASFHALISRGTEAVTAAGKPVVCSSWWWNLGLDQHHDLIQYVWAGLYRQLVSATDTS
jgi:hypothetical protein